MPRADPGYVAHWRLAGPAPSPAIWTVVTDANPVDELLSRAALLTAAELVELGKATTKAMGFIMRPRKEWTAALTAASAAAARAQDGPAVGDLQTAAMNAVFVSAASCAASRGKDPARVLAALDGYKQAIDSGAARRRQREFARMQRALLRSIGLRVERRVGPAVFGAAGAVTAVSTWDLASLNGSYTAEMRRLLVAPWRRVADLPTNME